MKSNMNRNERICVLIRMLRELDVEKNSKEAIREVLDFIAKDLELLLGGHYDE